MRTLKLPGALLGLWLLLIPWLNAQDASSLLAERLAAATAPTPAVDPSSVADAESSGEEFERLDMDVLWLSHLFWRMEQADIHPMEIEIYCRDVLKLVPVNEAAVGRLVEYYTLVKGEVGMAAMASRYAMVLNRNAPVLETHWAKIEERLNSLPVIPEEAVNPSEALLDYEQWMDDARRHLEAGKLILCENTLRSLFVLYPKNREIIQNLGSLYVLRREWALAAMVFTYAHWLYPKDQDFANNYALSLDKLGRTDEALEEMIGEFERYPKSAFHARNCGYLALKLDRIAEARDFFSSWVELDQDDPLAWIQYGLALKKEKRLPFAKVAFQRAHELDVLRLQPILELARIAAVKKQEREVKKWLAKLKELIADEHFLRVLGDAAFDGMESMKKELLDAAS